MLPPSPALFASLRLRPAPSVRRFGRWTMVVWVALAWRVGVAAAETSNDLSRFRVAFSTSVMAKINENDAKAAVKVWADGLIKERAIQSVATSSVLSARDIVEALNQGEVDGAVLTTPEFLAVEAGKTAEVFIPSHDGDTTEEYVVLARQDSGMQGLADLRGKQLLCLRDFRTSLVQPWLDVALSRERLPVADQFFAAIVSKDKPALVVLPVFFRSADACVVNRRSLDLMTEMNPQIGKQLRVIASSPKLVAALCCLAASYQSPVKPQVIDALLRVKETVAGRQILTVFQFGDLVPGPADCLQSARELLAEHARLTRREAPAANTTAGAPDDLPPGRAP